MVFGELVDAVPILGSQRRVYVLTGGVLIAAGLLMLAGAAGGSRSRARRTSTGSAHFSTSLASCCRTSQRTP